MSKSNRRRRPARSNHRIPRRKSFLILTEGKTEKLYIEGFVRHLRTTLVTVKVLGEEGEPLTIVREAKKHIEKNRIHAKREKDVNILFDSVWVVFDRDTHDYFSEAIALAKNEEVSCAISNPCFELWLYLHFNNAPGMLENSTMIDKHKRCLMQKIGRDYEKAISFSDYQELVSIARKRACDLSKFAEACGEPYRNPSTGMWMLLEEVEKGVA